jgi:hypothetical protein
MWAVKNREERFCLRENHKEVLTPDATHCQTYGEKSTCQPTPRTALFSANVA